MATPITEERRVLSEQEFNFLGTLINPKDPERNYSKEIGEQEREIAYSLQKIDYVGLGFHEKQEGLVETVRITDIGREVYIIEQCLRNPKLLKKYSFRDRISNFFPHLF